MAAPGGRAFSGRDVRFFVASGDTALTATVLKKIRQTYNNEVTGASRFLYADVVGAGKFLTADSGTTLTTGTGVIELTGVDAVPSFGTDTSSSTVQAYGGTSFNIPSGTTISDVEITFFADLTGDDAHLVSYVDSDFIPNGTVVLFLARVGKSPSADHVYHVVLGQMSGLTYEPSKEGAQSYTRRIVSEAALIGIPSS